MKFTPQLASALLALVLALGLVARVTSQNEGFRDVVNVSLATSDGYDQKFIDLVNHLEDVLTTRASFPYPGGKDPMTGRRREVAAVVAAPPVARRTAPRASRQAPKAETDSKPADPSPPVDNVRLTAIIADDYGQHTAIVMDGERSLSVDVGDRVGNRKVLRISSKELTMEDDTTIYSYGLSGTRNQQRK